MSIFALQSQVFRLAGSGASISDTSITLVAMKGIEGNAITMAQLGSKAFATIEPGSGDKEEQISFTGITQNPNGTATLTGVKSVSFYTPYTETDGLNKSHSGGVAMTLSNTSGFYNALFNSINKFNITAATTANLSIATDLENGDIVDGYTLATGDTVLVKNQTTQSENGVYIVNTSGAATRAGFFNDDLSIRGAILMVAKGTANQGTIWRNTNATAITVGVTNITFDDYVKTVDNVGTGEGEIFRDKVGGTGNLKTIKQSGKITVTNNADDITIDTTAEINTASNVGTGEGTIFKQKTVEDLELKTIKAGTNITITNNADDITISSTDTGEVNTASNVGAGSGLFKQKTGSDLEFKTLIAGAGVSLTDNTDDVTIKFSPATAKATGSEIDTGTDNDKYVTSKAITDSKLSFTDGVETLTNKTIDLDDNTILNAGNILIGENLLDNSNFINASLNGYGGVPDNWLVAGGNNPVQGGFPEMTKQQIIDLLGVADGDIEGLWNLNEASGNAIDLSTNAYNLTASNMASTNAVSLMEYVRSFNGSNSNLSVTNPTNLNITGNQTWFAHFRIASIGGSNKRIMWLRDGSSKYIGLGVNTNGNLQFFVNGITGDEIDSKIKIEANKWYFVVGVFDTTNGVWAVYVNGVKYQLAYTGTKATLTTPNFYIGSDISENYFDGQIQACGILSTALTETEIKKLWSFTTYKGMRSIRTGSNCLYYNSYDGVRSTINPALSERLRGKNITFKARIYQTVANSYRLGISTSGGDTTVTSSSTINAWTDISVTRLVPSALNQGGIALYQQHVVDSNVWLEEVALYEGNTLIATWNPSQSDWSRFPRLMRMDPPADLNGGYHFEENRWYAFTPVAPSGNGSMTITAQTPDTVNSKYLFNGKSCTMRIRVLSLTLSGTASNGLLVNSPAKIASGGYQHAIINNNNIYSVGHIAANSETQFVVMRGDLSNYVLGAGSFDTELTMATD